MQNIVGGGIGEIIRDTFNKVTGADKYPNCVSEAKKWNEALKGGKNPTPTQNGTCVPR